MRYLNFQNVRFTTKIFENFEKSKPMKRLYGQGFSRSKLVISDLHCILRSNFQNPRALLLTGGVTVNNFRSKFTDRRSPRKSAMYSDR